MKKLDKLIVNSFFGPFFLTFFVVVFILLLQFLLKYFDDLVGKGLGFNIYMQLLGYFSINMTPNAFPLAVLLSSLMTFGNLGEHSELTAIKSSGVSLIRALMPIFIISIVLTVIAYVSNNYIVPKANLKAYSLLWDIKNKTPALNLKEGVFYSDIPGYQIKVAKKFPDGKSLKDIMIYDHTQSNGDKNVTLADSGQMYTILNSRYLVMDLYNGHTYSEEESPVQQRVRVNKAPPFSRITFKHSRIIFSMASFDLKRTKEELFKGNRVMKDVAELRHDVDSMRQSIQYNRYEAFTNIKNKFKYLLVGFEIPESLLPENNHYNEYDKNRGGGTPKSGEIKSDVPPSSFSKSIDSKQEETGVKESERVESKSVNRRKAPRREVPERKLSRNPDNKYIPRKIAGIPEKWQEKEDTTRQVPWAVMGADSILNGHFNQGRITNSALTDSRYVKNNFMVASSRVTSLTSESRNFQIQRFKIFAQACACLIMFLIGAPLGAIIKKGGLGFPVIVSIGFFIIYYVFMIMGEKWAKNELISPFIGVWIPNLVLIPIGILFLIQARRDAKLFEADFYLVIFENLREKFAIMVNKKNA